MMHWRKLFSQRLLAIFYADVCALCGHVFMRVGKHFWDLLNPMISSFANLLTCAFAHQIESYMLVHGQHWWRESTGRITSKIAILLHRLNLWSSTHALHFMAVTLNGQYRQLLCTTHARKFNSGDAIASVNVVWHAPTIRNGVCGGLISFGQAMRKKLVNIFIGSVFWSNPSRRQLTTILTSIQSPQESSAVPGRSANYRWTERILHSARFNNSK